MSSGEKYVIFDKASFYEEMCDFSGIEDNKRKFKNKAEVLNALIDELFLKDEYIEWKKSGKLK